MSHISTEAVTKSFGGIMAVDRVTIRIGQEESVGLIGPNGSGKSTLLGLLGGQISANAGQIRWAGRRLDREPAHRRARTGIARTFQHAAVFGGLTVEENLKVALSLRPPQRPEDLTADQLARAVGIEHLRQAIAGTLSWGESRLLGLALALAVAPQLLLVDEPFAGLSPAAADQVLGALNTIRSAGIGLLVVDHEMNYLQQIAARMVAMVDGKVVADGRPGDVIADPEVQAAYLGVAG